MLCILDPRTLAGVSRDKEKTDTLTYAQKSQGLGDPAHSDGVVPSDWNLSEFLMYRTWGGMRQSWREVSVGEKFQAVNIQAEEAVVGVWHTLPTFPLKALPVLSLSHMGKVWLVPHVF